MLIKMESPRKYSSKVLLFGEYGILYGTQALAIPFKKFYGYFDRDNQVNKHLQVFYEYLVQQNKNLKYPLDLKRLFTDIQQGLTFKGNIPIGYGIGSSGALSAAIYTEYGSDRKKRFNKDLKSLLFDLAIIESCFHGKSSGFDPMVSLTDRALYSRGEHHIEFIDFHFQNDKYIFVLLDSGGTGATAKHVHAFKDKLCHKDFERKFREAYSGFSDGAVQALLNNKYDEVFQKFGLLSEFQFEHMNSLITENLLSVFESGLKSGEYFLKLCGSGGGGFYLAMVKPGSLGVLEKFPLYVL
jgi:mevalonate kinase